MKTRILVLTALAALTPLAHADCVVGVKSATKYQVIDQNTLMLSGGYGGTYILKSFSFFTPSSTVLVLEDSFCDFASAVLYVDGKKVDVQQVKHLD